MKLKKLLPKKSGRSLGKITIRHQGGRHKRFLREIDFKRDKKDIRGRVEALEYDPNRNVDIALIVYADGERRYILAVNELKIGDNVIASEVAPVEPGNCLPLTKLPIGTMIHNIELTPKKGGQLVKSAGSVATVYGKEEKYVLVKLPSGEVRRLNNGCWATVGQLSGLEQRTIRLSKAGIKRRLGIRPSVRGVAMHPKAHPHGGGEGRSSVGLKYPKTVYGRKAVGKTRRKDKYSDKMIVSQRKMGSHH